MNSLGNKKVFAANLLHYMRVYGVGRSEVCKAIGVPYTTFADWENAKSYPRIDKIEKLANYFNVPKSALIEEPSVSEYSNEEREIIEEYRQLNDSGKEEIMKYIRYIRSRPEYKKYDSCKFSESVEA